jgi:hypothetical protein
MANAKEWKNHTTTTFFSQWELEIIPVAKV